MYTFTRRGLLATGSLTLLALAACSQAGSGPASERSETNAGPTASAAAETYALVTYPVGSQEPADLATQLAGAQASGEVSDALLLKSKPSVEGPLGFASLAVLKFPSEDAFVKWQGAATPKLGKSAVVRRADLLIDEMPAGASDENAYVVSHYEALIPADRYTAYTRAYISPNMDGQKAGGVLTGYAMYYEREPVPGIKGNRTVLVKRYVDEAAFNRSEAIKEKDKERLLKDPEWKKINDTKATLRNDISGTLALPVKLP